MTIPFSKYVRITSGVGASVGVRQRDLIGRLFTSAETVSPSAVLEFTDAASVGSYFGTESEEYRRASFYFAYQAPTLGTPRRISFARFSPNGNVARVYGAKHAPLATLSLATSGSFTLVFDGVPVPVSGVNLSADANFTAVARTLTTAIQATDTPNTSAAFVMYDAIGQRFVFSSGAIANVVIDIQASGSGNNDLATNLGWASTNAIQVDGTLAQTVSDAFSSAENITNNFGAFSFIPPLSITQHAELAALNAGRNVMYMYLLPVSAAHAESWAAALIGFAGTGITLSPLPNQYPELLPMAILAATDYGRRDAVQNYMFRQAGGLTPSVTNGTDSDTYDAMRVNYYGRTQAAGQFLDFYQRGLLCGGAGAPVDMNVHANEQWLKDAAGSRIMSLLLSSSRVPANSSGRGQILAVLQQTIDDALFNGTISVGKPLTNDQKVFLTQQTGDPLAWLQVQNIGYWVDVRIVQYTGQGNTPEYKSVYTLLYSKDDAVRFVDGAHLLV